MPLPACGTRPIVQQQRIWHLYRVVSENISEWKCMAFAKVLTPSLDPRPGSGESAWVGVGKGLQMPMCLSPYSSIWLWPRRRQMAG